MLKIVSALTITFDKGIPNIFFAISRHDAVNKITTIFETLGDYYIKLLYKKPLVNIVGVSKSLWYETLIQSCIKIIIIASFNLKMKNEIGNNYAK